MDADHPFLSASDGLMACKLNLSSPPTVFSCHGREFLATAKLTGFPGAVILPVTFRK